MSTFMIVLLTVPAFFIGYAVSYAVMTIGVKQDKE